MEKKEFDDLVRPMIQEQVTAAIQPLTETISKAASDKLAAQEEKAQKDLEGKFPTFGSFLSSIYHMRQFGRHDNRLIYVDSNGKVVKPQVQVDGKAALAEGADSTGGFLVPEEYRPQLIEQGLETAIVRNANPMVVPMSSDTLRYPGVADTSHASSVVGGIVAYWEGEGADLNESEPTFRDIQLTAKKLAGYTKVSEELLQDSAISLEPFLRRRFADAWAWYEDMAFLRGTGSGQPLGVHNAGCKVEVTRQDTDNVLLKDIYNIYSRTLPGSRDRAVWILNHEVLPELLFLNAANTVTNAYGAQAMFQQSVVDPVAKTILGRPFFITEKMPGLGDAGDLGFYDFSHYIIGDRKGLTIDMSGHVYFTSGYVAFRFSERVDGQPDMRTYFTPYGSQDTLGPFVALGAAS
jgi:HK97 family phage major capsid protein